MTNECPHARVHMYFSEDGDLFRCLNCSGTFKSFPPGSEPTEENMKPSHFIELLKRMRDAN